MKAILEQLYKGEALTRTEAETLLLNIGEGVYNEMEIAALLSAYRLKTPSVQELLGFRQALRATQTQVDLSAYHPIDIVGTGGDGKNTFNISTCACFVVAGAGYKVAKHGNYSSSSVSGASNVIESHGVKFTADATVHQRSIEECGIAYLHAQCFNPAMKTVGPVRKSLAIRTFFNLLGPLINPCSPQHQLLGVASLNQMRLYAHVFEAIGMDFTIVNSLDQYDEISLTDDFKVMSSHYEHIYTPEELGLQLIAAQELYGGNSIQEARIIFDRVLHNEGSVAQQQCVVANAAFAIQTLDPEKEILECVHVAQEAIKSGAAQRTLEKFVRINS